MEIDWERDTSLTLGGKLVLKNTKADKFYMVQIGKMVNGRLMAVATCMSGNGLERLESPCPAAVLVTVWEIDSMDATSWGTPLVSGYRTQAK